MGRDLKEIFTIPRCMERESRLIQKESFMMDDSKRESNMGKGY